MSMTLRAVSLNDHPLTQPITARFDERGGTIGRANHNTLALPDPERHISRQQAEIGVDASGYVIRNIGSANPIVVRGQPVPMGESAPLAHGDQVRIGGYLLEVVDEGGAPSGMTVLPRSDPASRRPPVSRPVAPLSSDNPFADLLNPRVSDSTPAARLPDNFDPFAQPSPRAAPSATPAPSAGGSPFGDLIPAGAASGSIDDLFDLRSNAPDALADFLGGSGSSAAGRPAIELPTDPLEGLGFAAPPAGPERSEPDRTPELRAAFKPPPVAVPRIDPPKAERLGEGAATPELWDAFCKGAGVQLRAAHGLDAELMRVLGMLLRASVEGTLQLMAVRAATKLELHAGVTRIQAHNNNPLKFSPDAQSALEQLLQPPLRGFLGGPAAMSDAMHDLVGHAIGSMVGMRAAFEGMLGRFEPKVLEDKLTAKSVVDSLLPMNRKAKLWDLYQQHFGAIRQEAEEDFDTLFGKAFLAAYEQQLQRLQRDKRGS